MDIVLSRFRTTQWGTDGHLFIGGLPVADTTEHPTSHLPPGIYPVTLKNMPLKRGCAASSGDTSIYVGQFRCAGVVIKSRETFQPIYDRIQKSLKRGHTVNLIIE